MSVPFRTILSPIDFDHNSIAALDFAGQLARAMKAKVVLLHVVPSSPSRAKLRSYVDICLEEERVAREKMAEIAGTRLTGLSTEVMTRTGSPAVGILHTEEEVKPDLVVLATHSCKRTPHAFSGSVAERVVRESICPVLTIHGCAVEDLDSVGAHMTTEPVTAAPDSTVSQVWNVMLEKRLRCMPVIEEGRLAGVITDRDLKRNRGASGETPISKIMTKEVVTASPQTSIQEAARLLLECEVGALPVVDGEEVIGILTTSDILQAFVQEVPGGSGQPRLVPLARKTKDIG
jgi:CBS domain-containing protein/nucleotide-binding universal stress UspA family protein